MNNVINSTENNTNHNEKVTTNDVVSMKIIMKLQTLINHIEEGNVQ